MTEFINILFVVVSILFFAGRFYEVMFLLEPETNFLVQGGIVTTPLMLAIIVLISVCCGVLLFSDKKPLVKKLKIPVGIFGYIPALCLVGSSVYNIIRIFTVTGGFLGFDMAMILGSVGFALFGTMDIRGKDKEKIPFVLTMLIPVTMCLSAVIGSATPIADTVFMYRGLSAVFTLAFFILLFKNAYAPSKLSRPALYIVGLLNFIFSTATSLAHLIGGFVNKTVDFSSILYYIAVAMIGAYSLFTALYVVPEKNAEKAPVKEKVPAKPRQKKEKAVKVYEEAEDEWDDDDWENDYTDEFSDETNVAPPSSENPAFRQETQTRQIARLSEATIATLFAQKDEREHQRFADEIVKEVEADAVTEQVLFQSDYNEDKYLSQTKPVNISGLFGTQEVDSQPVIEKTTVINTVKESRRESKPQPKTEKSVFRSNGSKSGTSTKTVYKAPKK